MTDTPKPDVLFEADPDSGEVGIWITVDGKPKTGLRVPVAEIGKIVFGCLGAAVKASNGKIGPSGQLNNLPSVQGIRFGIAQDRHGHGQIGLILHAGLAQIAIPLNNRQCVELGQILLAAGGAKGHA